MTVFATLTEHVNDAGAFVDAIAANYGKFMGACALMITVANRVAKVIPTEWDNKIIKVISRVFYWIFAIIGVNVPDIVKIKDGKIKTVADEKPNVKGAKDV